MLCGKRAIVVLDDVSVGIDECGKRHPQPTEFEVDVTEAVLTEVKEHAGLVDEAQRLFALVLKVETEEGDLVAQQFLCRLECCRHLSDAGWTPRCPEVDHDRPAFVVRQGGGRSVEHDERGSRRRVAIRGICVRG